MITADKQRVGCFVDGYNFYYALFDFAEENDRLEWVWCDLYQLTRQFIDEQTQQIANIYYCSSMYDQANPQRQVQQAFVNHHKQNYNQEQEVFQAVWGQFKPKRQRRRIKCPDCSHRFNYDFRSRQEKRTDINIAQLILTGAYEKKYDMVILISSDSDFLPVLDCLSGLDNGYCNSFKILMPPGNHFSPSIYDNHAKYAQSIEMGHLERAAFTPPDDVPDPIGLSSKPS